jgi:hypothetical protein
MGMRRMGKETNTVQYTCKEDRRTIRQTVLMTGEEVEHVKWRRRLQRQLSMLKGAG